MTDIAGQSTEWLDKLFFCDPPGRIDATNLINEMIGLESVSTTFETDDQHFGYRPYPIGDFCDLLYRACMTLDEIDGRPPQDRKFLEVGSGPGTKLVVVSRVFGMIAEGFDVDSKMVETSRELLKKYDLGGYWYVEVGDAEDYGDYGEFDIVFLNRPLRDYQRQVALEEHVMNTMSTKAVLMLGNGLTQPIARGWSPIAQKVACTVWLKQCPCYKVEDYIEAFIEMPVYAPPSGTPVPSHSGAAMQCKLCGRLIKSLS